MYLRWHVLDHGPALRNYAHRVVTTSVFDHGRRPWRRERGGSVPDGSLTEDPDRRLVVLAALRRLPERRRACVVLRYFSDLSVDEVASILGITAGTVKSQTARAIEQLRSELTVNGLDLVMEDS
jgi:RNA polymerase sigma factor (sigma-70 family)